MAAIVLVVAIFYSYSLASLNPSFSLQNQNISTISRSKMSRIPIRSPTMPPTGGLKPQTNYPSTYLPSRSASNTQNSFIPSFKRSTSSPSRKPSACPIRSPSNAPTNRPTIITLNPRGNTNNRKSSNPSTCRPSSRSPSSRPKYSIVENSPTPKPKITVQIRRPSNRPSTMPSAPSYRSTACPSDPSHLPTYEPTDEPTAMMTWK
jgi:hypothetical protein